MIPNIIDKQVIGDATLYCGDALQVFPLIEPESVDVAWLDPPYGHNNNNGDLIAKWEQALGRGEYIAGVTDRPIANDGREDADAFLDAVLHQCARVLRKDCCCCCCCCGGGGPSPTFAKVAQRMDSDGLRFFHAVVWDKGGLGMGWRYRRNYEFVMVSHRKGGKLKWEEQSSGQVTANVVRIGKSIPSADEHPTPKPVQLVSHFLRLHAKAGDVVLDPCMGAGVSGVAAVQAGCRYIGIELERRWFDMACERIERAERQGQLWAPSMEQASMFA